MAGTIIADYIRADANRISLNVGNTVIASINASGILSNTGNVLISPSGTFDANNVTAGTLGKARLPSGSILQVVQAVKTDTFSISTTTFTDVTGMSVSITPTSSTSKILVMVNGIVGYYTYMANIRLLRNSTAIGLGDVAGSRPQTTTTVGTYAPTSTADSYHMVPFTINYLDSPATTSAITYKIQLAGYSTNATYINRSYQWQNTSAYDGAPSSTITVMEIAQ